MATAVESAVRLPTPEPGDEEPETRSRKRQSFSRSPSPRRNAPPLRRRSFSRSPPAPGGPLPRDVDRARARERARQLELRQRDNSEPSKRLTEEEKQAAAKAEFDRMLKKRSGGTYIPPARLRALQAQITDKTSAEYQRMAWDALKKSINGMINKVNVSNIKHIVPELFGENLIRGRGLFCRSIMKAQAASLPFTPIYAAMAAIVNTKLPQVGELLVRRLALQFRKAFKRNDKSVCHSSTTFIAHLTNQQVVHELAAAQILTILLSNPTEDSVEIAVGLMKEVGQFLEEMSPSIAVAIFDQFRSILHEADIDKRVQYMIEVLFQVRKDQYKEYPAVREELDLIEEEDQITHRRDMEEEPPPNPEEGLNIFKVDPEYEAGEEAYRKLKSEILGEGSDSEGEEDADSDESSEEEDGAAAEKAMEIKDQSNTDLVNLRRSIYLTIMSSGGFEEACHKLMRINLPSGREEELPSMIIECCSQERTYNKFYGLIGERFCKLNRLWRDLFQDMFTKYYETIHRYQTNRLRIIAQFFGHLLSSDAVEWAVLHVVRLNEEDTTSSSRIFIKFLIEELAQGVGMKSLQDRLNDAALQPALAGIFPTDNPKDTRFSINFFTAIGMGALTEGMREWLKNMPKPAPAALPPARSPSRSSRGRSESVSSYSSYSSRDSGRSDSRSQTPPRRRSRARSYTRSPTPDRRRGKSTDSYSRSRSPPRKRGRSPSYSRSPVPKRDAGRRSKVSRSPPRRGRARSYSDESLSRSPPRRRQNYSPSRSPAPRSNSRRRSASDSRSPPRRKARLASVSASPPPRGAAHRASRDRSPPRKRPRSVSSYDSRSPSRSSPRRATAAKRRRNTSSPEGSRSRSPPRNRAPPRERLPKPDAQPESKSSKAKPEDDMSHIHPSRRGLMGGPRRRAQASDFM